MEQQVQTNTPDPRSLGQIIHDIVNHLDNMIQAEIRLVRAEIVQKIGPVKRASVFLGIAALTGLLGAACFVTTCIAALNLVMPLWLAALLIGIGLVTVAGGAFVLGRNRIDEVDPVPRQTMETLREDLEWVKHHIA